MSEQRVAIGGGSTPGPTADRADVPAWSGLDGGGDELRGLRVDNDVPAEHHARTLPGEPPGEPCTVPVCDPGAEWGGCWRSTSTLPPLEKVWRIGQRA